MTTWAQGAVERAVEALTPLADEQRAGEMAAYMKGVASFLGVQTPERRRALRAAWSGMQSPSSDELGEAAALLMAAPHRELHYGSADLVARFLRAADETFLPRFGETLLLTTPWWDTVDAHGSATVSPLCRTYGHADLVDRWNASGDRWLVRASIQHQRGWKGDTDVARVLDLCRPHVTDREFFVAKGIGWALRDLAWIDRSAVEVFLADHPDLSAVARREARRGLEASARSRSSA